MNYRDVERRLRALGCVETARRGGGSHRKWFNPKTGSGTTVPDWGHKDLKTGTLHAAVKQLGIEWSAFQNAR